MKTRNSKEDLPPPKIVPRPNHHKKKPKSKVTKSVANHWLFGSFINFELDKTLLPTKKDVVRRYLSLKYLIFGDVPLNSKRKYGIFRIVAKELIDIWMYSSVPYVEKSDVPKYIRSKVHSIIFERSF